VANLVEELEDGDRLRPLLVCRDHLDGDALLKVDAELGGLVGASSRSTVIFYSSLTRTGWRGRMRLPLPIGPTARIVVLAG
jgi:hypothetical protein